MRKLIIIFMFLMINVWFALGWTPPSPITPPNTVPDAVANMNFGITGGSVPAAPGGEITYDVGNIASEHFTGTGTQLTWIPATIDGTWEDDDTTLTDSETGWVGDHLRITNTDGTQSVNNHTFAGGGVDSVYFRFYFQLTSETYGDESDEEIFSLGGAGNNEISIDLFVDIGGVTKLTSWYNNGASENYDSGAGILTITAGTTYKIEGRLIEGGASDVIEWSVDGTVRGTKTGSYWAAGELTTMECSLTYNNAAATINIDTVDVDSTGALVDE